MVVSISLLRTIGFRMSALYFSFFLLLTTLCGFGLYQIMAARLVATHDNLVWRDAAMVSAAFHRGGQGAAIEFITHRVETDDASLFYLADYLGQYLAGNLKRLPPPERVGQRGNDWLEFAAGENLMRGRVVALTGNLVLLVAHDIGATYRFIERIAQLFVAILMALAVLGLVGAVALARANVRRINGLNDDLHRIMQGNIEARMKRDGKLHEFDALAAQINRTLERLATLMAAMREVTDNLAHDLRQPLTRLRTRLEQMPENDLSRAALKDIDGVLAGFAALLSLSRLESGITRERRRPIDMTALLTDMTELYEPVFAEAGMALKTDIGKTLPPLLADRDLLAQALVNLLENALRYAATGTVHLTAEIKGDMVALIVADEGVGIDPKDFDRVQQRFVRLESGRSGGGYGLGLSLVAAIARAHGGDLALSANAPQGLIVSMCMPINGTDGGA